MDSQVRETRYRDRSGDRLVCQQTARRLPCSLHASGQYLGRKLDRMLDLDWLSLTSVANEEQAFVGEQGRLPPVGNAGGYRTMDPES